MDCLAAATGGLVILVGAVGCFLPVLPGPLIAYGALWVLYFFGGLPPAGTLLAGAVVVAAVSVIDYILPSVCAKKFHCSGLGVFGCFVGSIAGIFFLPWGIVLGPFIGTVAGELAAGKNLSASLRGGVGSLLGYVVCLILKLCAVAYFAWRYFSCLNFAS